MKTLSLQHIAHLLSAQEAGASFSMLPPAASMVEMVTADSRETRPGSLFVAIAGSTSDGHAYVDEVRRRGALAAVVSDAFRDVRAQEGFPLLRVRDTRRALSALAAEFAAHPSKDLFVCGVTGTNGKTTTHWMVFSLLAAMGRKCLRIGTVGVGSSDGWSEPGALTTPDPIHLHSLLHRSRVERHDSCVMEVSSHALHQRRVDHIDFDIAVFTNLTRDHLDYHASMEEYFQAKKHLFDLLAQERPAQKTAVIGIDDSYGARLGRELAASSLRCLTFGTSAASDVRIVRCAQSPHGSDVELEVQGNYVSLRTPFIGLHNAQNLAAAVCVGLASGADVREIVDGMQSLPQVPGRLEAVFRGEFSVFVDYAHSPDALHRVLESVRQITKGRLFVLFGCGGDRDRGKRPLMGDIAATLADVAIVTSDNPRTEDPEKIVADILAGQQIAKRKSEGREAVRVIIERERAIEHALAELRRGDILLIAGKGHEDYQIIGTEKRHFSDQEHVKRIVGHAPGDNHGEKYGLQERGA